ncbi:polynucleotide adenylyltransferase PcnB [Spirochaetia bacterium 38H-sp]|uniref:Polynucleotide adenylyltransferase PcnB n=1 Tax=Rarispira pelagica TaxID=3141764 RepID=A0ABU9UDK2_9SPIR
MRIRYSLDENNKPVPVAKIYTDAEHPIKRKDIDGNAVGIIRRLQKAGHQAYIVGGAVRDLISGKTPKDFDIVTCASPSGIKKIFRGARIIGKRFRLVHVYVGKKYIEVSTFRALDSDDLNTYGTIEQDAFRRDFTINAMYYDPITGELIDFTDGYIHLRQKKLIPIINPDTIFTEDPVRIIRALKYAARMDLSIDRKLEKKIKEQSWLLEEVSASRLTEEIFKILQSGESAKIWQKYREYGIMPYLLPEISSLCEAKKDNLSWQIWDEIFIEHDLYIKELTRETTKEDLIIPFVKLFLIREGAVLMLFKDIYKAIKHFISPFTPPNRDIESAIRRLRHKKKRRKRKKKTRPRTIYIEKKQAQ